MDRALPVSAAGIESEVFASYLVNRRIALAGGRLDYSDLLLYFGKLTYGGSFTSLSTPKLPGSAGDDVQAYLFELKQRFNVWRPTDQAALARRIQGSWFGGLIDPTLWLSVYHLLVGRLWQGERSFRIPFIEWGDLSIYPATRFNPSPFGIEHYLDVFIHTPDATFAPYLRFTSSGLATDVGAGLAVLGWPLFLDPLVRVGAGLDLWAQPEILVDQDNVFARATFLGGSAAALVDINLIGEIGVLAKIAYKSRGYLMAQPLDAGPYGYVGFRLGL
jgi:hypothetical protein